MGHNFNEIGFTQQEEDTFWEELKKVGLLPGVNEKKTRFEIVTTVVDLTEGPVPAVAVVYEGTMQGALEDMEKSLTAVAKIYDSSNEALQMHLEDQMPTMEEQQTDYEGPQEGEWTGALRHEQTDTKLSFSTESVSIPMDGADQRPYAFGRLLDVALAAVRYAKNRPVNPMVARVQKTGAPMDRAFKLAVWKLLEIFERDTGVPPTVHKNQSRKVRDAGTDKYTRVIFGGNFLPFAVACLSPANLILQRPLNSSIWAAYTEWNQGAPDGPASSPSET
ncbi:MAG: hypothetical protein KF751_06250 [Nitrospira sp.]|nr:hypothetical protein [Nitrospira sp.]